MISLNRPEDFIVTEIDLAGNPVILDMKRSPPPLPVRKRLSLEEERNHDSSSHESGSSLPDSTHLFDISSLISDQVMSSLDLLAKQWEESAITSATPPDHFINLGIVISNSPTFINTYIHLKLIDCTYVLTKPMKLCIKKRW